MKLSILSIILISIINVYGEDIDGGSVGCGGTVSGYRDRKDEITYTFTSDDSYSQIQVNACGQDTTLQLAFSGDIMDDSIANTVVTQCQDSEGDDIDGLLTVTQQFESGDTLSFVVEGEKSKSKGDYSITITCYTNVQTSAPTTQPTVATNSPTTSEPTTASPTTAEPTASPTTAAPTTPVPTTATPTTNKPTTSSPTSASCSRHREPWHLTSEENQQLYIDGFKALNDNGKLTIFNTVHRDDAEHGNTAFNPWHRYFLWEFETQIRSLGEEYECFALPYWDWAADADEYGTDIDSYYILNSGLGSRNGNSGCCKDSYNNFNKNNYSPEYSDFGSCLMRSPCQSNCYWTGMYASELVSKISDENLFFDDDSSDDNTVAWGYGHSIESYAHNGAHMAAAGDSSCQLGTTDSATNDPIFWLLHAFVDFQWTLFQDCRNHEAATGDAVTSDMYTTDGFGSLGIDDDMDFGDLEDDAEVGDWDSVPYAANNDITPRLMNSNKAWDVTYDQGSFFDIGNVESNTVCNGNIDDTLFIDTGLYRRRRLNGYGEYDSYSQDSFNRLNDKVGGNDKKTLEQNAQVYSTWATMDCEYATLEDNCKRPKYFDDCSDMTKSYQERNYGRTYLDINITLAELIEKVEDYPCMVETREKYYDWAYNTGSLYGLCSGEYDRFCDKSSSKQKGQKRCEAEVERNGERKRQSGGGGGGGTGSYGYSSVSGGINVVKDNGFSDNNNGRLSELEHILISGVVNGVIITTILATIFCCYWVKNNFSPTKVIKSPKKKGYKYDAVDVEEN